MKIVSVRSHLLSYPLPEPLKLRYHGGHRTVLKRDAMLIRVETENGLVGYAPGEGSEKARDGIECDVAPFLEGRLLADPDALRIQFLEGPAKYAANLLRLYCLVEIALYDLLGKSLGIPVSELLGGRVRDHITLYGSAGMYMRPQEYADEAAAIAGLGFRAYKMRPGIGPDQDLEAVRLMRQAVGPDFDLMVDGHTWWRMGDRSYGPGEVQRMARQLGEWDVAWLEEPLPPEDHAGYRELRRAGHVAIASGEHEPDEAGFLDLISTRCVDYVQMDILCQGGYPGARRLFPEIEHANLRFAFHSWGTALEVMAAAQLGVCWPENLVEWLEYPCYSHGGKPGIYPFPLADEILMHPLQIEHGDLIVPRSPGLGVEVNEGVIEQYPWLPGPWSYFHIDSPAQTKAVTSDHSEQWYGK